MMLKAFKRPARRGWWLAPAVVAVIALGHTALAQGNEDGRSIEAFMFRVSSDMAQCSAAYRVTSEVIGGPEGKVLGNLANGFEHSSGLVASLAVHDRERAREYARNCIEVFANAWVVKAKRALEADGFKAYYAEIKGLCEKYATLNGELVQRSLQFGYAGNTDASTWGEMVTDAVVRFMQTPGGQEVVLEVGK